MIDDWLNEWIKPLLIPKPHMVSGKTTTVRMEVLLKQMIPGIIEDINTEEGRLFALYYIHKASANLLQISENRKVPINTVMSFVIEINKIQSRIILKELNHEK